HPPEETTVLARRAPAARQEVASLLAHAFPCSAARCIEEEEGGCSLEEKGITQLLLTNHHARPLPAATKATPLHAGCYCMGGEEPLLAAHWEESQLLAGGENPMHVRCPLAGKGSLPADLGCLPSSVHSCSLRGVPSPWKPIIACTSPSFSPKGRRFMTQPLLAECTHCSPKSGSRPANMVLRCPLTGKFNARQSLAMELINGAFQPGAARYLHVSQPCMSSMHGLRGHTCLRVHSRVHPHPRGTLTVIHVVGIFWRITKPFS
ncbi:hypothetical protein Dimus_028514, partial [Dionaea muscipula]